MGQLSLGDLAGNFLLRRQNYMLKTDMARLSAEISTGRTQDTVAHLGGRLASLAALEHDLSLLDAHRLSSSEAGTQATAMQAALGRVQDAVLDVGDAINRASFAPGTVGQSSVSTIADETLEAMISALNTQVAGRSLFAGNEVNSRPLADADILLDALRNALSGATTGADVLAASNAFFSVPGGGFETLVYQGATSDLAAIALGDGETVDLGIRADDPALRAVIRSVAVGALVTELSTTLPDAEVDTVLEGLAGQIAGDKDDLIRLRADLGYAEERIEFRSAELGARQASMTLARNELLAIDSYQAVTEFEAVQLQLETLYSLTARSSRLSLVNYLS